MSARIVCWFSCGVASAVATKLALNAHRGDEVVVARCIVVEEHPDNDRFARDCERWFGVEIKNLSNEEYKASVHEVIRRRRYISGVGGAPCTMLLKKKVREEFELPTDTHVFGYTVDEGPRFDRFLDANNIRAIAPLIGAGLTHGDCLALVQDAGIRIPEMYRLGFKHNNCIGCVKATGAGYWNKVRKEFPVEFTKMAEVSRALGVKMSRIGEARLFLDELPKDAGNYQDEPEIQCGIFCEMAKSDLGLAE